MKAKCIKADPLDTIEVGKVYELVEHPFAFSIENGDMIVFAISKEVFNEHFEML